VFPEGSMYVYDMDNNFSLVKTVSLPQTSHGTRGVVASPATHMLYISIGGDGGSTGTGGLLEYDLLTDTVVWTVNYPFGIDSMAITPDGKTIYMPDGGRSDDSTWHIIDAASGNVTGGINIGGSYGAHNTIVSLDGTRVYLGALDYNYLDVASTLTNTVTGKIGPLNQGVRPFTINGKQTLAFTTASSYLGFQVSSITTGQVLYNVPFQGFSYPSGIFPYAPSHGISLSPDETEIYVIDQPNSYVHVFDVRGLPGSPPTQVADIPIASMSGSDSPCTYDCQREGWLLHSRDGRFVLVGDSGDVIATATRKIVANLAPLANTRKYLEIDWQNGVPIFTTSRSGRGYVTP
jgi:DNA-binding beta-propeller fold protein YncE